MSLAEHLEKKKQRSIQMHIGTLKFLIDYETKNTFDGVVAPNVINYISTRRSYAKEELKKLTGNDYNDFGELGENIPKPVSVVSTKPIVESESLEDEIKDDKEPIEAPKPEPAIIKDKEHKSKPVKIKEPKADKPAKPAKNNAVLGIHETFKYSVIDIQGKAVLFIEDTNTDNDMTGRKDVINLVKKLPKWGVDVDNYIIIVKDPSAVYDGWDLQRGTFISLEESDIESAVKKYINLKSN